VFVIASARDDFDPAKVLFEFEGVRRDIAPSRESRQEVAGTIAARFGISRNNHEECVAIGNVQDGSIATLSSREYKGLSCGRDGMTSAAVVYHSPISLAENTIGRQPQNGGNGDGFTVGGPMYTLNATGVHGVAQPTVLMDQGGSVMSVLEDGTVGTLRRETHGHEPVVMQPIGGVDYENNAHLMNEPTGPLLKGSPTGGGRPLPALVYPMAVRRLTPVECERLQGFPDNYTNIPWRKKEESPDGPRYKALGNSMAVPVMAWIGRRIANVA
jgi:DNA (cytosine-5)-methyltransferase 1